MTCFHKNIQNEVYILAMKQIGLKSDTIRKIEENKCIGTKYQDKSSYSNERVKTLFFADV